MMDTGFLLSSGTLAILVAYVVQGLKKAPWFPWLTIQTGHLNLLVSAALAMATSVGVHWTWHGGEDGTLMITGLTLANLQAFLGHAAAQFAAQHIAYKTAVVPTELLGAIVKAIQEGGPKA